MGGSAREGRSAPRSDYVRSVLYRDNIVLRRTFRYRIYPTRGQERLLTEQLCFTRELYNAALEQRIAAYRLTGRWPSHLEQSREFTKLRRECPQWLPPGMSRSAQQYALRRLELAFRGFLRRARAGQKSGFPRFKGPGRWDTLSAQWGNGAALRDEQSRVYWAGVGLVKVNQHRPIPEGAQRKVVSVRRQGRHWFVCVEVLIPRPAPLPRTGRMVGIDLGITTFAALSTGELVEGPRAQRSGEARVARLQREISRKKHGSKRRRKAAQRLAHARMREARVRRDHHFKVAVSLVEEFDLIAIERLNVMGLISGTLAKDCQDAAWGQFTSIVSDKAEEAGRTLVFVNPKHTSQLCSGCGQTVTKTLSERWHSCSHCGLQLDRDVNAARNVLRLGASQQLRRCGVPHGDGSPC
jgi:putative transposase